LIKIAEDQFANINVIIHKAKTNARPDSFRLYDIVV